MLELAFLCLSFYVSCRKCQSSTLMKSRFLKHCFGLFKKHNIFKSNESVSQTTPHMEITYIKRPPQLVKSSTNT